MRLLAASAASPYTFRVIGPSTKPKPQHFVPHPDDVDAVREGAEQAERGELLSVEECEAYLRRLRGDDDTTTK